ncbi:protein kinase domain-containing protein [Kitasatospora sp. NPDC054939]
MTEAQGSTGRLLAGRYRLEAVIGRGGMGTVWRAEDEMLGRTVAVKELRMNASVEEDERHRLITRTLREAKATARIRHSSAVTVFDVVEEDDRPWIVMELVESRSLADVVKEDGPLEPARAAEIALDVLGVLGAAHALGILHRDVKPSNVLISEDGRVVLTDFGIASVEGDASVTSTGMLVGAPSYISPERARGQKPGPPADLWSLGGTLYAMVEGRPPYDRGSALATLTAVMTEELTTPANAGPLAPVIEGLLDKDPAKRLDASQTRSMLRRIVAESTTRAESTTEQAVPAPTPAERAEPEDAARRPVAGLLGTVRVGSRAGGEQTAEPKPAVEPKPAGEPKPSAEPKQADAPADDTGPLRPVTGEWNRGATQAAGADPRKGRRRLAVVAAVLVLLLIAGVVAVVQAFRGSAGTPGGGGTTGATGAVSASATGASPSPSAEASGSPTASASASVGGTAGGSGGTGGATQGTGAGSPTGGQSAAPTDIATMPTVPAAPPQGPALPAGYREHKDSSGFSIALPDWLQPSSSTDIRRTFKGNGVTLVVEWTTKPGESALADWQESEPGLRGSVTNYQRVALQSVAYREWTNAADWEWTFGSGARQHSLNRGFVTGKYGYAIYWTMPDADWGSAANAQARQTAFDTFHPAP